MTQMNISQYESSGDSVSLTKIDGQKFTIVKVEKSDYEDAGTTTEGVKISTSETFKIDGKDVSKFHTTRTAVVNKLKNEKLRSDLDAGIKIGPMKCEKVEAKKGGKPYFDLVDV